MTIANSMMCLAITTIAGGFAFADEPKAPAEFVFKDWKFAARFSSKPKEQQQAGPLNTKLNMFMIESKDGMMGVAVAELPIPAGETAEQSQARLDGSRDGAIKNIGGKLKESKEITTGKEKYPGREFSATITKPAEGQLRSRIFLVDKRLYQVMVMGTNDYATSKEATAFLESFRITE